MPSIDFTTLTLEELLELEQDIKQERQRRRHEERATLLAQAEALAKRHGITLDELLRAPKKQPLQTWSGRGKEPAWIQEKKSEGVELETLKISEARLADSPDDTPRGRKRATRQS